MRVFYNKLFDEIKRKIEVKLSTSKAIWQRIYDTVDDEGFHEILAFIESKEVSWLPTKVIDGILELLTIWTLLYKEKDKTFEQVLSQIDMK